MILTSIGFIVSLAWIIVLSRKNLALAIISGALLLGLFTLSPAILLGRIIYTLTDISIVLLALAMGIIPILGGTMKASGQIDGLVNNLRISKRYMLAFSASLMGLLPMPGGALLSAPILERAGEGVDDKLKSAINNWFRHLLILIYPLSPALIVATKIAELDIYTALIYLMPGAGLALILGYVFYLRKVEGKIVYTKRVSLKGLIQPLIVILSAPIIDFTLKRIFSIGNLATLIGVSIAFILSIALSRKKLNFKGIIIKMKPWNFALIIIGMFIYLHVFQASDASELIAALPLPPLILAVVAGFTLGIATGRVQLPISIIIPIYLSTAQAITPFVFTLIYIGIFFGYIISPIHPCLVVTCEYFRISIKDLTKKLAVPTLIVFGTVLLISIIVA